MAEYYVVRDKNTGLYFRGKGVNRWGKYYNQASIYRIKANAENTIKEVSWRGEQAEVVPIQIIENTADVVPKSEVDRLNAVMKEMDEQRAYTINMLGESLEKAKSEADLYRKQVDELEDELASTYDKLETAKAEVENLKVLLEMTEKAHEGLKELYHTDTDALVEARRKTEVEVAREIFEEIESKKIFLMDKAGTMGIVVKLKDIAKLKKKYTEGTR